MADNNGKLGADQPAFTLLGLSGVTECLIAKHFDPHMGEGLHEHTWRVTAFYASEPFRDGRAIKAALRAFLDALPNQNGALPDHLWSGEALARATSSVLANIVLCHVWREEGFEAWA